MQTEQDTVQNFFSLINIKPWWTVIVITFPIMKFWRICNLQNTWHSPPCLHLYFFFIILIFDLSYWIHNRVYFSCGMNNVDTFTIWSFFFCSHFRPQNLKALIKGMTHCTRSGDEMLPMAYDKLCHIRLSGLGNLRQI